MRARLLAFTRSTTTLAACGSDFQVAGMKDPNAVGDDTGVVDDDAPGPEDTGVEEDEEPAQDDPAIDEDPVEDTGEPDPGEDDPVETDDPAPEDDCEDTSDLVYVIDRDTERLFLFDPPSRALSLVGTLDCSWLDGTPASMAVARDGVAYVRYSSNTVFAVDLATLDCAEVSYDDRVTGFGSFGMGFATDSADTWRDQLYIANRTRLAKLDTATWQVTSLGTLPSQAELTGTADGELWAMLPLESPALLVELDKGTGAELSRTRLTSFPSPSTIDTFAFAAWGGSHYLFVRTYGMGESTDVYEVDATGTMRQIADRIGINVVGAGVSTCAPTE